MAPAATNESLPGEPTNLQRRQNADDDTENRNNSGDRRASNLKAYHEGQIAELQKEIRKHEAIVDQQDKILSGELDANTPLPAGTDIGARFNQGEDGDGERPPATVNELRAKRREEENGGNDDTSDTSDNTSDEFDPTSVNPDDKQPEDKSGDDENDKREKIADAGGQKAISNGEGEFEGARPENSGDDNSTDGGTNSNNPEPTSTPAEPVNDDAPKQDENKLDDATKPVSKTPTSSSTPAAPSPKRK